VCAYTQRCLTAAPPYLCQTWQRSARCPPTILHQHPLQQLLLLLTARHLLLLLLLLAAAGHPAAGCCGLSELQLLRRMQQLPAP
jgi:hypothetical protein